LRNYLPLAEAAAALNIKGAPPERVVLGATGRLSDEETLLS